MEFSFDVNVLFRQQITRIVGGKLPRRQIEAGIDLEQKLATVVDEMGISSASAQGLRVPITTFQKLQSSNQILYILKDGSCKGAVVGILKVGHKRLFLADPAGVQHEVEPLCVLDFYVHESRQRGGCGKMLFETMMQMESVKPSEVAIDRPSPKFLRFLKKHYKLQSFVKQANNFVVFDQFFSTCIDLGPGTRRLSLQKPGQSLPDYGSPSHDSKLWRRYSAPFSESHSLGSPGVGRLTMLSVERPSPLSTTMCQQKVPSLSPSLYQSHAARGRQIANENISPQSPSAIPSGKNLGHAERKSSPHDVRKRNPSGQQSDFNWSPDCALKRQKQGESRAARHTDIITGVPLNCVTTEQSVNTSLGLVSHRFTNPHLLQPATNDKAPFLNMRQQHKRVAANSVLAHGSRAYHAALPAQPTGFHSASEGPGAQLHPGPASLRYSKHRSMDAAAMAAVCGSGSGSSGLNPVQTAGKSVTFASGIIGTSLSAHRSKHKDSWKSYTAK